MYPLAGHHPPDRSAHRTEAGPARHRRHSAGLALLGAVVLAAVGLVAPAPATGAASGTGTVRVIVTGPGVAAVTRAVTAAGGTVTAEFPLIGGAAATLPDGARLPGGFVVTPNREATFTAAPADDASVADAPVSTVRRTLGLPASPGREGRGVTVALVDTGVADVGDLAGQVAAHLDVTGSGSGDGEGHGTFMAGLIAGAGAASHGAYAGVAPGAKVLDVKVARADGTTDLGSVLSGLQAVADQGHRYGVEVLNLSLDSASPVPYQVDPLNQALRALWRTGITVVVPSGNQGPGPGTVATPGNDPALLTVGGDDENGTADRSDDTVAAWSGRGPTDQGVGKPDLVAPGAHLIGLRSPGSVADLSYPQSRVGTDYFRGSGTSMSTAVTSGAVADLLARFPQLRPDDVKGLLTDTAYAASGLSDVAAAGTGGLDLTGAMAVARSYRKAAHNLDAAPGDPGAWKRLNTAFDGQDPAAVQKAWDALSPEAKSWAAKSWASLDPQTQAWVAKSWAAKSWAASSTGDSLQEWAAKSWAAKSWAGDDWAAKSWAAKSWGADSWTAAWG